MTENEYQSHITRRGDPKNAGYKCQYSDTDLRCPKFGRYQLAGMKTVPGQEYVCCGQHITHYTHKIWNEQNSAAIIQEVPGMWRHQVK